MERKVFYVLVHRRCSVGIERVEGYEFEINGENFYGYADNESRKVYIVDPDSGRSIYMHPIIRRQQGVKTTESAIDGLMRDKSILEAFKKKKGTKEYGLMQEIFRSFLHGAELEREIKTKI